MGNAYSRLFSGNETAWNLGAEYSQPLGLRFANQQVKNNELKLTKAMTILEAQEAEILLQLTNAFQQVDRPLWFARAQAVHQLVMTRPQLTDEMHIWTGGPNGRWRQL